MQPTPAQPDGPVNLSGHMPPLDGLRGAALLMVLFYHCALTSFRPAPDQITSKLDYYYYHLAGIGWSGVDLFFVLSGFLITGILIDTRQRRHYFRNFYMRRVLRIFPLYYALLVVVFFLLPPLLALIHDPPPELVESFRDPAGAWWFFAYVSNFYAADVGHLGGPAGETNRALAVLWSLAIEEQFYMVWPLVVFLVPTRWLARVCVGVIVAAVACRVVLCFGDLGLYDEGALPTAVYVLPFCRMDALAIGALIAVLGRRRGGIEAMKGWGWGMLAIGAAWMAVCVAMEFKTDLGLTSSRSLPMQVGGYSVLALGFAGVLIVLLNTRRGPVYRLFTCRPMTQLGQVSYGMYLFHVPLLYALSAYGFRPGAMPRVAGLWLPAQLAFTLVIVVLTYGLALLSWHGFEKRLLKLKRYFPSGAKHRADERRPFAEGVAP